MGLVASAALAVAFVAPAQAHDNSKTLKFRAKWQLAKTGLAKYLGEFEPKKAEHLVNDWTRYTYDTENGDGPICVDGSPFNVYVQERSHRKVVVFLNGGGACWQNFYNCSLQASANAPGPSGIFADSFTAPDGTQIDNPFEDYSKVFVSYCDGSVFQGDNDVQDSSFPAGPVRYHRGVRNLSAALDLSQNLFPEPRKVLLTGASAGGYGVNGTSAVLSRFIYPNTKLRVLNDSGPVNNPANTAALSAQANDWQAQQFYPRSCRDCDVFGQPAELLKWWLRKDRGIRTGLFSYDADGVIRFFNAIPTASAFRTLLLDVTDPINARHPRRYKRFITNGPAHTILGSPAFYTLSVDGVAFYEWTDDLVNKGPAYRDIVAPAVP